MSDINYFAETNFRNARRRFGIQKQDRDRHFYVIGKTGTGKTTMLDNMAIQDIQAGHGLGIIDPHGEFAERMLDFIPKDRINDVIYFNPEDATFPIAFNIMENVREDQRPLVAAGLMGVFKKLWPDVWSARMEYILSNTVLALLEHPDATLLGINRMLSDKDYRKQVISYVTDDVVRAFWTQEFAKYTDKYTAEATPAIQNKIGQLITSPLIRNIIGQQKSSIDLRRAIDEKKILLVNLSKGKIGEGNSSLLGSMLVTKLYFAAMTRVDLPIHERSHFYLYVDEFQNFATPSFANILSEARKYGLSLILAHQYIAQLDETVRDAIFGNVGTMVAFRIGGADAEVFEKEFTPEITTQDFVNAEFAQIYVRLMINGLTSRPFSAITLPPMPQPEHSFKREVIEASRKRYGTPQSEVTERIRKWWEPIVSEEEKEKEHTDRREKRERSYGYDFAPRNQREGDFRERRFPERRDDRPPRAPRFDERAGVYRDERFSRPLRPEGQILHPPRSDDRVGAGQFHQRPERPTSFQGEREERSSPPPRTISLRDLQPKERRDGHRDGSEGPREQKFQRVPPLQSKESNLDELREMLAQIRPQNKQKPSPPKQENGPQNLNPGEQVKL
jgi:hypothetical protein